MPKDFAYVVAGCAKFRISSASISSIKKTECPHAHSLFGDLSGFLCVDCKGTRASTLMTSMLIEQR